MNVIPNSPIAFPGLFGDWQFTADSVALHVGHGIYWYGILLALGVLGGLWLCCRQAPRFGLKEDNVLDLVLWGVPIGILGARTYYVIFYQELYRTDTGALDWGRVVAVWDGGLAIYGTVIAAFALAIFYCRHKKLRLGAVTDLCVMGLMLGQAIGRWGNFMNREAFGAETTLPWRMRLWTGAASYMDVHPTFLYESLWNLLGLCLALFVISKARRFDGENTWFYFLWYGLGRAWIEGLRTDSLYLFDWTLFGERVRVSQALSLVLVLIAACVLFVQICVRKHAPEDLLVNRVAAAAMESAETAEAEISAGEAAFADGGEFPKEDISAKQETDAQDGDSAEKAVSAVDVPTEEGAAIRADEPAEESRASGAASSEERSSV